MRLDDFRDRLQRGVHELAITPTVVFELAAPLIDPSSDTVITRLLNDLETLPITYLANGQISPREIEAAIESHSSGIEYVAIDPFVDRLDAAIPISGPAPTAGYLHHGLAETVFTIWQSRPDVFQRSTEWVQRLQASLSADRALPSPPRLDHHFREKFRRDLRLYGIREPASVDDFADWVYESSTRCPGLRLAYETYLEEFACEHRAGWQSQSQCHQFRFLIGLVHAGTIVGGVPRGMPSSIQYTAAPHK